MAIFNSYVSLPEGTILERDWFVTSCGELQAHLNDSTHEVAKKLSTRHLELPSGYD